MSNEVEAYRQVELDTLEEVITLIDLKTNLDIEIEKDRGFDAEQVVRYIEDGTFKVEFQSELDNMQSKDI